jgi:hypothetical protein
LKKLFSYLLCSIFIYLTFSCNLEEESVTYEKGAKLHFSEDTILFDTVFATVGSITKRLKVYNRNSKALIIEKISLGKGGNSPYKIFINGVENSIFSKQRLLGRDSLLILIKVHINPGEQNLPFLVKDSIVFFTNSNEQDVKLVSWGQNAHFLKDSILSCNSTWSSEKPYVIYKNILIDTDCDLIIKKGTRIYLNNGSNIFVKGAIKMQGTPEERVLITNSRLDRQNDAGQWGGIYFLEGSKNNSIDFALIKNGSIGLRLGTPDNDTIPDVILSNSIIENMSVAGILAFNSDLYAYNSLINNAGQFVVSNLAGGNYTYDHCTFTNYWSFRKEPLTAFTNFYRLDDNSLLLNELRVNLMNTIIWGNLQNEVLLSNSPQAKFIFYNRNNLLKTNNQLFSSNNNIINKDPLFVKIQPGKFEFDFRIKKDSPAINMAKPGRHFDILGKERGENPDIGAFEFFED